MFSIALSVENDALETVGIRLLLNVMMFINGGLVLVSQVSSAIID